ncbi:MAG: type I phosphomannose isomerase catalytic subunit [Planctomycetota bacterium]|jgi:mannose-6-phosphate isomerase
MQIYPLKFEPIFKHRLWGGQKLREFFGKGLPVEDTIGESWELADLPEDKSIIVNGEMAGLSLPQVLEKYPKEITGDESFHLPFPLLIKLLDAQDILSVQVHPDPETCKRTGKGDPKTECWYIIDAEPESFIYKGLKPGTTKEQFAKAIEDGNCEDFLEKIPVKPGECHFLPAGTCHSIGAGLLIAEIQTPSETTYRVYDFNRVEKDGKPRQLHIEDALESIHFDPTGDNLSVRTLDRLVDSDYFYLDKGHQAKNCEQLLLPGQMKVLIFLKGSGKILEPDISEVDFKAGDLVLIPAEYKGAVCFNEETQYLTVTLSEKHE